MNFFNDEAEKYYNELISKGRHIHPTSNTIVTVEGLKKAVEIFDEMDREKENTLDYYFTNIPW